jgi:hypothetical protein
MIRLSAWSFRLLSRSVDAPSHVQFDLPAKSDSLKLSRDPADIALVWFLKPDEPEQAEAGADPLKALGLFIDSVRTKASANERSARVGTGVVIAASFAIPVLLIASTEWYGFFLGKLLPALFAAIAGGVAGWLQWSRPNERWKLYRSYQRAAEVERLRYDNKTPPYDDERRNERLVARLAEFKLRLHDDWAGLVPRSSDVLPAPNAVDRARTHQPAARAGGDGA